MLSYRELTDSDAEVIARFPRSAEELFYLFPSAEYPLKPDDMMREAYTRSFPTVVLVNGEVAGYGNLMKVVEGSHCSIGNVIVNPAMRNSGVATYLIELLTRRAVEQLNVRQNRISCFNLNTAGLLLYHKLGFIPFDMEPRAKYDGEAVVLIHMRKYVITSEDRG